MIFKPNTGVYPTMITPYNRDYSVDYGAVSALVEWYYIKGCDGIFASCQSSEIHMLSLDDRVKLAATVKDTADRLARDGGRRMTIVASGHISDSFDSQLDELRAVRDTGVESVIMISNRFDIENTSDERWISELSRMIDALRDIPLGIYECPRPYKRLLTPAMIEFMVSSGRFAFIKDTCCDADEIDSRIKLIQSTESSGLKPLLFNANAQTLLETLRSGAAGYCGVMANFHPELYVRLCEIYRSQPEAAELLAAFLSQAAFIEGMMYPSIAKYHLDKVGVKMLPISKTSPGELDRYKILCVDKMDRLAEYFTEIYCR